MWKNFIIKRTFIVLSAVFMMCNFLIGCSSSKNIDIKDEKNNSQKIYKLEKEYEKKEMSVNNSSLDVSVMVANVGKADAIAVTVNGKNYIIDTGTKDSYGKFLNSLNLFGVDEIEAVFLTHTHSDHVGGMKSLAKSYNIPVIYSAEISEWTKKGKNKISQLANKIGVDHVILNSGDKISVSDDDSIFFEVIAPLELNVDDDNDNSLVLRLDVNGRNIIFTGDMQFAEEKTLLEAGVNLDSDILKVGNHGNKDATLNQFANEVSPIISLISTDTSVDTNSANKRVKMALGNSDIYITEDYENGIVIKINHDSSMKVEPLK